MRCEETEELISGYLDGELTQQEGQRVAVHLEDCPRCRKVHDEMKQLKAQMNGLDWPSADEAMLARIGQDLLARGVGWLGWTLLLIGLVLAIGAGLFLYFANPETPLLLRVIHGLMLLGGLALFLSVLRQRLLTYKKDKYRRVKL